MLFHQIHISNSTTTQKRWMLLNSSENTKMFNNHRSSHFSLSRRLSVLNFTTQEHRSPQLLAGIFNRFRPCHSLTLTVSFSPTCCHRCCVIIIIRQSPSSVPRSHTIAYNLSSVRHFCCLHSSHHQLLTLTAMFVGLLDYILCHRAIQNGSIRTRSLFIYPSMRTTKRYVLFLTLVHNVHKGEASESFQWTQRNAS